MTAPKDEDHIFQSADGRWSFYDETDGEIGRYYPTKERANQGLTAYCEWLDTGKEPSEEDRGEP